MLSDDAKSLTYLYAPRAPASSKAAGAPWGAEKVYAVTHWAAADLSSPRGRALVAAALDRLLGADGGGDGSGGSGGGGGSGPDDDAREVRIALLVAPRAAPSALDAAAARALRAYRAAAADAGAAGAADGALLRFLRALLRAPLAEELSALPVADAPPEEELAQRLLPLAAAAGVVEEGAPASALAAALGGLGAAALADAAADAAAHARLAAGPLRLERGAAAAVTNGRVILDWAPSRASATSSSAATTGSSDDAADLAALAAAGLTAEDFALMQMYAADVQPGAAMAATARAAARGYLSPAQLSDALLVAASAAGAQTYPDARFGALHSQQLANALSMLRGGPAAVEAGAPAGGGALLRFVAVLNPLTREAQRMGQVLGFIRDALGPVVSIQLHLNPKLDLTDMPLRSFYR